MVRDGLFVSHVSSQTQGKKPFIVNFPKLVSIQWSHKRLRSHASDSLLKIYDLAFNSALERHFIISPSPVILVRL